MIGSNVTSFLHLGFFLGYQHPRVRIDISGVDTSRYRGEPEENLVVTGAGILRAAVTANYDRNSDPVVPISGGLDSRALLAGLLEHTCASRIHTYTYGTPGTWDYDIGCEVARRLGTKHRAFDLTRHVYRQDELEDISRRIDRQAVLFHHGPVWEIDREYGEAVHWSGFLGETLTGSHLPRTASNTIEEARELFLVRNRYAKSGISDDETLDALSELIDAPEHVPSSTVTYDEQLDFFNRQLKFIAPIVLMQGYSTRTPFLYQPWIDFSLSLDNVTYRREQRLYKLILQHAFPAPFRWRTKTNRGLPLDVPSGLKLIPRMNAKFRRLFGLPALTTNYLDMDRSIREKPDLKTVISNNIHDLEERKILDHIQPVRFLKDHLSGHRNCADLLIVFTSLEIHIKSGKQL